MDNVYRAIGRFVVEFSQLQHMMEFMTVLALPGDEKQEGWDRAWSVISGRTAQAVVNGFFSLCVQIYKDEWTEEDLALLKSTRKEIQTLIEERNRLAHDVWSLGHPNYPVPDGFDALRFKYGISGRSGALRSARPVAVSEIDSLSDTARRLNNVVRQIGILMRFPPHEGATELKGPNESLTSYKLTDHLQINEEGVVIVRR